MIQESYIERVRSLVRDDARIRAALMYGSFARGEGDRHSDIEFYVYLPAEDLVALDRNAWVAQVAPVELSMVNEFGTFVVVFDSLVRGEFHFEPDSKIFEVQNWIVEPLDPNAMVLKDQEGTLLSSLERAAKTPYWASDDESLQIELERLLNWLLLATNVFARGEYARTLDALSYAHRFLLRAARLRAEPSAVPHKRTHWLSPTRDLEKRAGVELLALFTRCTADAQPDSLHGALDHCWRWGTELAAGLEIEALWRRGAAQFKD